MGVPLQQLASPYLAALKHKPHPEDGQVATGVISCTSAKFLPREARIGPSHAPHTAQAEFVNLRKSCCERLHLRFT